MEQRFQAPGICYRLQVGGQNTSIFRQRSLRMTPQEISTLLNKSYNVKMSIGRGGLKKTKNLSTQFVKDPEEKEEAEKKRKKSFVACEIAQLTSCAKYGPQFRAHSQGETT